MGTVGLPRRTNGRSGFPGGARKSNPRVLAIDPDPVVAIIGSSRRNFIGHLSADF